MTPEQERAEARKLADKVKYRIGMIEGGYAEGGIAITTPELKVLLEDYRNSLDREEQLIKERDEAIEKKLESYRNLNDWQLQLYALQDKVAEQDKEIQRLQKIEKDHIDLLKLMQRAKRMAYAAQEEQEENRPRFKMDANGNLTRVED